MKRKKSPFPVLLIILSVSQLCLNAQKLIKAGDGWANTSVNTVIFRKNSVVTYKDHQFIAYYDSSGYMVLGKRLLNSDTWEIQRTPYTGNVKDAHNCICIITDGEGYLHIAWDHHNSELNYVKSVKPLSLQLSSKMHMTGKDEIHVTYPEFYSLPGGDLIFMYRNGASGNGNLVVNRYHPESERWERLQDALIDGEGKRNAYWQAYADTRGTIHLSWVWRESPDVASNHDLCYARSEDGGITWQKSTGEPYKLPVTMSTAEYASRIPQNSGLINQTSMVADSLSRPYIVTYWTPEGTSVPQYFIVYHTGEIWNRLQVTNRTTPFSLSGMGTRKIPISRPQVVIDEKNGSRPVMIFRDTERNNKVSLALCTDLASNKWKYLDLTRSPVGDWEPAFDTELWKQRKQLDIFVEKVGQGQGETEEQTGVQPVYILEWKP